MKLATVKVTSGGGAVSPIGTWLVTTPVPRGFQAVLYLHFDTTGSADAIEIDPSACQFEAVFKALDYDALHSTPPAALSLSKDGKAVIVKLDGPRRVLSVSLAAPPRSPEIHRADGAVQADKAADTANFTDVNFAVQFSAPVAANQLTAVNVRGLPANPRLALAGADLASPELFWPTPDAAGTVNVNAAQAFAKALQSRISASADLALVIQSDAPCQLAISKFMAPYRRIRTEFTPSSGPKEVLRYSGKRVERQSLSIALPTAANVFSASLKIDESFRRGDAVAAAAPEILAPVSAAVLSDRGILLSVGNSRFAAQRVDIAQASNVTALALGVLSLSSGASLGIELQSDHQGAPSGKKISEVNVKLADPGVPDWVIASFPASTALSSGTYWIVARALKGEGIWLAEPGDHPVHGIDPANGASDAGSPLDGLQAMCRLLPQSPTLAPLGNGVPPPAHTNVSVGAASALPLDGGFDLTELFNAYLTAARSGPPATVTQIPIVFTSTAQGLITVYPPRVVYDFP